MLGITCFQTNGRADQLSAEAVITEYRLKNRVEEAFHEIQSPPALRPLFVSRAERIRAHFMTCVLAYLLNTDTEERLAIRPDQSVTRPVHRPNPLIPPRRCNAPMSPPAVVRRPLADRSAQSVVKVMQNWLATCVAVTVFSIAIIRH